MRHDAARILILTGILLTIAQLVGAVDSTNTAPKRLRARQTAKDSILASPFGVDRATDSAAFHDVGTLNNGVWDPDQNDDSLFVIKKVSDPYLGKTKMSDFIVADSERIDLPAAKPAKKRKSVK